MSLPSRAAGIETKKNEMVCFRRNVAAPRGIVDLRECVESLPSWQCGLKCHVDEGRTGGTFNSEQRSSCMQHPNTFEKHCERSTPMPMKTFTVQIFSNNQLRELGQIM